MRIGLIGYGGVGEAFIKLIEDKKESLRNKGIELIVNYIIKSDGGIYDSDGINLEEIVKCKDIKKSIFWSEYISFRNIIKNNDVDIIVELTPTNRATGEPGITHMREALKNKINVVTGNKGPILLNYRELKNLAKKNNVSLEIGCTTGGALPSINTGLYGITGSDIITIEGVLNGTSNFILKKMEESNQQNFDRKEKVGLSYNEALEIAKKEGIAEADPTLDVEGFDTAIKMIILTNVLLDQNITLNDVEIEGISKLKQADISKAYENNKKIKLLGKTYYKDDNVKISVKPTCIDESHPLYNVDGKNKGVTFNTDTLGEISVIGGASGVINAAASILRDIVNIVDKR